MKLREALFTCYLAFLGGGSAGLIVAAIQLQRRDLALVGIGLLGIAALSIAAVGIVQVWREG